MYNSRSLNFKNGRYGRYIDLFIKHIRPQHIHVDWYPKRTRNTLLSEKKQCSKGKKETQT